MLSGVRGHVGLHPSFPDPLRFGSDARVRAVASLHLAIRASAGGRLDGFAAPRLLGHATSPFEFPLQVGPTAQGRERPVGLSALTPSRVSRGSTAPYRVPPHTQTRRTPPRSVPRSG